MAHSLFLTLPAEVSNLAAVYMEQGPLAHAYMVNFFNIFVTSVVGGIGLKPQLF